MTWGYMYCLPNWPNCSCKTVPLYFYPQHDLWINCLFSAVVQRSSWKLMLINYLISVIWHNVNNLSVARVFPLGRVKVKQRQNRKANLWTSASLFLEKNTSIFLSFFRHGDSCLLFDNFSWWSNFFHIFCLLKN